MCTSAGLPQSANNFINFYPVNHSWTKDYSSNYPHIKNYKHYDIQVHHTVILPGSRLKAVLTHSEQTEQKLVAFFPCIVQKFTILQFFFYKSFLNLSKPRGVNAAKADRTMTAQSEKSIICKKPRLTALHAGIVLIPPLTNTGIPDIYGISTHSIPSSIKGITKNESKGPVILYGRGGGFFLS